MVTKTDLNISPYYDDFDEDKSFHRVLFKPATAVQARELTQLQTILQNQVKRFGDNVLQEGTIVKGGNFVEEASLPYVKVRDVGHDVNDNSISIDVTDYIGHKAVGLTTGLEAIIIAIEPGLESQSPNLNTLYVKYINNTQDGSGNNISAFSATEEIRIKVLDDNNVYQDFEKVTAAGSIEGASTGNGYGVRCGDGVMYNGGHFVKFDDDITIVSKYDTTPNGIVVGFETIETIINSNQDQTLLDNAAGFNNHNAPGADRLKIEVNLVAKTLEEADADEEFFSLQEYENGSVVRRRLTTQFDSIEAEIARRTAEESGDYTVNDFKLRVDPHVDDSSLLSLSVGAGVAYVEGNRIELVNEIALDLNKSDEYNSVSQQDIIANYGQYVIVDNYSGEFDFSTYAEVELKDISTATIGHAKVRFVKRHSSTKMRIYLVNIVMSSGETFADVRTIEDAANGGSCDVVLVSGEATITDATFKSSYFNIGQDFIRSIDNTNTDFVYRNTSDRTSNSAGVFSITIIGGNVFPYTPGTALNSEQLDDLIIIAKEDVGAYTNGDLITASSATLDGTGTVLTVNIPAPTANMAVNVSFNEKQVAAAINTKSLTSAYIKIDTASHNSGTTGVYGLGMPDVFSIENVWKVAAADDYSEDDADDITDNCLLDNGQTDVYYGLSTVRISGVQIAAGDKILVKVKTFEKDTGDNAFFTVDSYPVDDVSVTLPADKIRTQDIPTYTSDSNEAVNLRDVIDMRPYATSTATYAPTRATATVNPASTLSFASIIVPVPNSSIETAYTYYLARNDLVYLGGDGSFQIIEGTPADSPAYPAEPTKGMQLAQLHIPPFPSLTSIIANKAGKQDYGVSISKKDNRRYTMKDIAGIDTRVQNIEYYTALSLLEKTAADMVILDDNGLDRFKNGILVDNFENLAIADVKNSNFAAGIDPTEKEIHPKFRAYPLDLKLKSVTNLTDHGEVVTLPSKPTSALNQPYATTSRSCTTSFYKYTGNMVLDPEYDVAPDYTRAPDINFNVDLTQAFVDYTEALNEFVPLQTSSISRSATRSVAANSVTITNSTTTTTSSLEVTGNSEFSESVGDFVSAVNSSPYMRSKELKINVNGLRPNTRFYFFFDGIDVNEHVASAEVVDGVITKNSTYPATSVISNENGNLFAVFRIPEETFIVGDRTLEIIDINDYNAKASATSSAAKRYSAFNFSVENTSLISTTRMPDMAVVDSSNTVVSTRVFVQANQTEGQDPIAQTFVIDSNQSDDSNIMLSQIDIYFNKKSSNGNGVTIELRSVENGYPGAEIIPFSSVHLSSDDVVANDVTASTATTVTFKAPIAIKTGTEYCVVIKPDGNDPDYRVWISKVGGTDVDQNISVTQDTNAGVLFTSTNNKAWTAYQDENLKFKLYRTEHSATSGSAVLTTNEIEIFDITAITGNFTNDEYVYASSNSYATGTMSFTSGNNEITGIGSAFTTDYNEGDFVVAQDDAAGVQVMKVSSISNTSHMIVSDIPTAGASSNEEHYASPVGKVSYFNKTAPAKLILEDSSAKTGLIFAAGDTLMGAESGAEANISEVVDLPVSYIQPAIFKTNFATTRTTLSANKLWNGTSEYTKQLEFKKNNYFNGEGTYIKSKSNDTDSSGFEITINLDNVSTATNKYVSPFVDHKISNVTAYEYLVNDDSTGETGSNGDATSKYISRRVELGDGLDAQHMKVYLTAYKPTSTDIEVYVKLQASTDGRRVDDVEWTLLTPKAETNVVSSSTNLNDYKEIEYGLSDVIQTAGNGAWDNNGDVRYIATDGSVYNNFKFFSVKIVMKSPTHSRVPRIKDMRALALT